MEIVCPATVITPLRASDVRLDWTVYWIEPFPVPELPPVIETQFTFLDVSQSQIACANKLNEPVPPEAGQFAPGPLRLKVQAAWLPFWLIVNVWPPTVIVPVRGETEEFRSTL